MCREKETNGKRKKEGVYARLKQSGWRKALEKQWYKNMLSPSRFFIFANVFNNFVDFHNNESLIKLMLLPWHGTTIKWDENYIFLKCSKKGPISNKYLET